MSEIAPEQDAAETARAAEKEKVYSAIAGLRKDTREEAGLGDAARQTQNIAVSNAAWELRTLIRDSPMNTELALEAGAIKALVMALKQRPNSEAVQSKCTTTLGYLAANSNANQTRVGEAGGIEAVTSALRGHPNSVAVLEHAVEALGQIVASDHTENQNLARLAGGIEAVTIALHQHPENEAVQKNAATTLGLLVIDNVESQLHCGSARGIQAIVTCLKSHLRNEAILEKAADALRHVVTDNNENKELAREAGTIATVLAVLRRHRKSEGVQVTSLQALTEIVSDNPENQAMAGEAGGIKAIISALNGHPGSDALQEIACETLGHLVTNNQVNQNLSREAGLIEAVIHTALEQHPASIPVQTKASSTLTSLVAHNAESQRLAGAAGGVEVITAGLKRHLDCEGVTEEASRALSSLVLNNRENQTLARSAGAIEAIILVLRQHPENDVVQMRALQSIRNLIVGNHENTRVAVSAGGIDEVVSALRQKPENADSSRTGSRGGTRPDTGTDASKSKKHHTYQKLAREAGVIEACVAAMQQPPSADKTKVILNKINAAPSAKLLTALRDLVAGSYESQRLAAEAGAVETVLDLIKSDPHSEVIQEHAARALCGLIVDNAANQRRGKSANADDALTEADAAHPENPAVHEAIARALEALHSGEAFAQRIMMTDYAQRHSCAARIEDTAMRGVTLEQLLELQEFIQKTLRKHDITDPTSSSTSGHEGEKKQGKSLTWEALTMYQMRDHFLLPLTKELRCSFVEQIAQNKQPQPPMWMISHWWGTPFPFTIRMLQLQSRSRHLHAPGSVSYWCCAFANNQHVHTDSVDESDVLRSPFARAMLSQSCMGTVLLCDTEVTPLLRTWCVFEAHVTQLLRCGALADRTDKKRYFLDILAPVVYKDPQHTEQDKVTITMLQDAVGGSWNEVSDTEGVFFPLGIAHLGVKSDVRMAETTLDSDKACILNFLTQGVASRETPPAEHPKYDEFNDFVHSVFASAELYRVASEQPQEAIEAATELIQMRADVNSFVRQGNTPLFAAAGADPLASSPTDTNIQQNLMELLLTARADVNRANASLKTVLDCSASMTEAAKDLLLQHGAKSFEDAAPDLEQSANAQLAQILATGFGQETQAFVGGDAGTKLTSVASHALQVAATSSLKLYHWAPCRMCLQTGAKRHQAQLAAERARSVMLALESAGCKNTFEIHFGTSRVLLSLTLSIAKPSMPLLPGLNTLPSPPDGMKIARWERALADTPGSDEVTRSTLRSPKVVLDNCNRQPLQPARLTGGSPDRLPPVTLSDGRMQIGRLPPVQLGNEHLSPFASNANSPTHGGGGTAMPRRHSLGMAGGATNGTKQASNYSPQTTVTGFSTQQSAGSDRCDGQIDLESSMHSNGSSLCDLGVGNLSEALTGNGWPQMISLSGQGPFDSSRDPERPGTRQDKRRPDVSAVRCEAWGSAAGFGRTASSSGVAQQSSSGGFSQKVQSESPGRPRATAEASRKLQHASSSGGFGSGSTLASGPGKSSLGSNTAPSPAEGSDAHLDVLAAGDRWFQTSISCSLSQPEVGVGRMKQNRSQLRQQQKASSNSSNVPSGKVIDQFGPQVPPTANGNRPGRDQSDFAEVELEDGRPPTRGGRRPKRMAVEQAPSSGGVEQVFAEAAIMGRAPEGQIMAEDPPSLLRGSSLPTLNAHIPRVPRTFRVTDLME